MIFHIQTGQNPAPACFTRTPGAATRFGFHPNCQGCITAWTNSVTSCLEPTPPSAVKWRWNTLKCCEICAAVLRKKTNPSRNVHSGVCLKQCSKWWRGEIGISQVGAKSSSFFESFQNQIGFKCFCRKKVMSRTSGAFRLNYNLTSLCSVDILSLLLSSLLRNANSFQHLQLRRW